MKDNEFLKFGSDGNSIGVALIETGPEGDFGMMLFFERSNFEHNCVKDAASFLSYVIYFLEQAKIKTYGESNENTNDILDAAEFDDLGRCTL